MPAAIPTTVIIEDVEGPWGEIKNPFLPLIAGEGERGVITVKLKDTAIKKKKEMAGRLLNS